MNEYHTTRTRRRSDLNDTTVPNKKMNSGDSDSSGSDKKPLTLVELFRFKEMKRIFDGKIVRWGCVMNKLLHEEKERSDQALVEEKERCALVEEKERSQESNRVMEELLNKEKQHLKELQEKRSKEVQ